MESNGAIPRSKVVAHYVKCGIAKEFPDLVVGKIGLLPRSALLDSLEGSGAKAPKRVYQIQSLFLLQHPMHFVIWFGSSQVKRVACVALVVRQLRAGTVVLVIHLKGMVNIFGIAKPGEDTQREIWD